MKGVFAPLCTAAILAVLASAGMAQESQAYKLTQLPADVQRHVAPLLTQNGHSDLGPSRVDRRRENRR